jgi:hypothetical protein
MTRTKIVGEWMCRLPVAKTAVRAVDINYRAGHDILIADSAEAFAQAVIRVLQKPDLARQ